MPKSEKIKNTNFLRKIRLFLLFFLVSLFFWFFITLTSKYSYWTSVKVEIKQNEQNIFLQDKNIENVNIKVKATGIKLIYLYIFPKKIQFQTSDFQRLKSYEYYYLTNQNMANIQKQWPDLVIEHFEKDTIKIHIGHMKKKRVPVKSDIKLLFKAGYLLDNPLKISPDSITVSGPEKYLEQINFVETSYLELADINSDFNYKIALNLSDEQYKNLNFEIKNVKISGNVSKYTEMQLTLPISVKNANSQEKIEVYPHRAVLFYQIKMEDQNKVKPSDFQISIELPTQKNNTFTSLPLQLSQKPDFIKTYRFQPNTVYYLMGNE